nr:hypothetical protein [Vibrio splendidus]MCC4883073.1 hypothetical protein [Vibrio splendidus]
MASCEIDLSISCGRVYAGFYNGLAARTHFQLNRLEHEGHSPIVIRFPDDARTMASSFFTGMFGDSVKACGSKEEFLSLYSFIANRQILSEVGIGIDEALA